MRARSLLRGIGAGQIGLLATARTGRNVVDPVSPYRFVGGEIHSDFHRRREPYEPLPEFDVGSDFFERGKNDLEVA